MLFAWTGVTAELEVATGESLTLTDSVRLARHAPFAGTYEAQRARMSGGRGHLGVISEMRRPFWPKGGSHGPLCRCARPRSGRSTRPARQQCAAELRAPNERTETTRVSRRKERERERDSLADWAAARSFLSLPSPTLLLSTSGPTPPRATAYPQPPPSPPLRRRTTVSHTPLPPPSRLYHARARINGPLPERGNRLGWPD